MILHQIAPKCEDNWHPIWKQCRTSWLNNYTELMLWGDEEIDELIDMCYPQYADFYHALPQLIMKIDLVRYAILHKFGGIYADMDMYCYKNFESDLKPGINLVGSWAEKETVQNSLMASTNSGNSFWIDCIENSRDIFESLDSPGTEQVLYIAGPIQLTNFIKDQDVHVLPTEFFNNDMLFYSPDTRTKHMLTGVWGNAKKHTTKEFDNIYKNWRGIDVSNFDFKKNYNAKTSSETAPPIPKRIPTPEIRKR